MKLIMKADDFGSTPGVIDGIAKAITYGIVRDTSFFGNTEYLDYAKEVANKIGLTECGLHLTLTYGKPVLDASEVPTLVDENGYFYNKPHLIPENFSLEEVEKEFRAQLARFKTTGIKLTHIDSHHHVHSLLTYEVVDVVMKIAKEENVPVRHPDAKHMFIMDKNGVKTTDYLDRRFGGNEKQSSIEHLLSILDDYKEMDCLLEIMCHPGIVDEKLKQISSFTYPREVELETLTSPVVLDYIKKNKIELVNFTAVWK